MIVYFDTKQKNRETSVIKNILQIHTQNIQIVTIVQFSIDKIQFLTIF
jgi:hypothetical protein